MCNKKSINEHPKNITSLVRNEKCTLINKHSIQKNTKLQNLQLLECSKKILAEIQLEYNRRIILIDCYFPSII